MSDAPSRVQRRLTAIFCADVAGYTRLVEADQRGTLGFLSTHRALAERQITQHGGRVANTAGDSILAEFPSAVDAVECALAIQERVSAANYEVEPSRRLTFRIGIHVGEVLLRDGDMFGEAVNIAARLQTIAEPQSVCLSAAAHEHVHRSLPVAFDDRGLQTLKNVQDPIRVFQARPPDTVPVPLSPVHRQHEFFLARRFAAICMDALGEVAKPEGLHALDCPVLAAVGDLPSLTLDDVAERVGIDLATAEASIERLRSAGLVTHGHLEVTSHGVAARRRIRPAFISAQDSVLAPLTKAEREILKELLTRVIMSTPGRS